MSHISKAIIVDCKYNFNWSKQPIINIITTDFKLTIIIYYSLLSIALQLNSTWLPRSLSNLTWLSQSIFNVCTTDFNLIWVVACSTSAIAVNKMIPQAVFWDVRVKNCPGRFQSHIPEPIMANPVCVRTISFLFSQHTMRTEEIKQFCHVLNSWSSYPQKKVQSLTHGEYAAGKKSIDSAWQCMRLPWEGYRHVASCCEP